MEKLLARDDIMSSVADLDALDPKVRDALLAFKGIGVVDADDDDSSDVEDPIRERMELEYDPAYDSEYDEEKVPFNGKREEFESDEEEEEHRLQNPEEHLFMPHGDSNPTETVRRGYLYPDELLHDFIPATHSERHNSTNQVRVERHIFLAHKSFCKRACFCICRVREPVQASSSAAGVSQCSSATRLIWTS